MEFLANLIQVLQANALSSVVQITWDDGAGAQGFYMVPFVGATPGAPGSVDLPSTLGAALADADGVSNVVVSSIGDNATQEYPAS